MHLTRPTADTLTAIRRFDDAELARLREECLAAEPWPHVVMTDLLTDDAPDLEAAFPDPDWDGWHRYDDVNQAGKKCCSDLVAMPRALRDVIVELSSPPFLDALEHITGIERLIPDPHLTGGGLHSSAPGGILTPHSDFHVYPRLGLYRRVNLLLYLNRDWTAADGGSLELYAPGARMPARRVMPDYGTCVVFRTDDRSVHGFTERLARERKSIALYYYTAAPAPDFGGGTTTYWRGTGGASALRRGAHAGLLFGSRVFSWLAHRVQPKA